MQKLLYIRKHQKILAGISIIANILAHLCAMLFGALLNPPILARLTGRLADLDRQVGQVGQVQVGQVGQ